VSSLRSTINRDKTLITSPAVPSNRRFPSVAVPP
jgi:hypothetical protein